VVIHRLSPSDIHMRYIIKKPQHKSCIFFADITMYLINTIGEMSATRHKFVGVSLVVGYTHHARVGGGIEV